MSTKSTSSDQTVFDKTRAAALERQAARSQASSKASKTSASSKTPSARSKASSAGSKANPIVVAPTEAVLRTKSGRNVTPPKPMYTPSSTGMPSAGSETLGSESTYTSSYSDETYEPSFIDDRTESDYTESTWSSVSSHQRRPRSDSMETHSDVSAGTSRISLANVMGRSREAKIKDELKKNEVKLKSLYQQRTQIRAREFELKIRLKFYEGIADSVCTPPLKLDAENVKAVELLRELRLRTDRDALTDEENTQYISLEKILYEIKQKQDKHESIEATIQDILDAQKGLMEELRSLEKASTPHQRLLKRMAPSHHDEEPPAKRTAFDTVVHYGRIAIPLVAIANAAMLVAPPTAVAATYAAKTFGYSAGALACQAVAEVAKRC